MATSIIIQGQLQGNRTLLMAIPTNGNELHDLPFNEYEIVFQTKKEAVKALSSAYRSLREEKEDWKNSNAAYTYASVINYDSSVARIC